MDNLQRIPREVIADEVNEAFGRKSVEMGRPRSELQKKTRQKPAGINIYCFWNMENLDIPIHGGADWHQVQACGSQVVSHPCLTSIGSEKVRGIYDEKTGRVRAVIYISYLPINQMIYIHEYNDWSWDSERNMDL